VAVFALDTQMNEKLKCISPVITWMKLDVLLHIKLEVVRDTTVVSRSSRYSGHDRRVRCICYYQTRPFFCLPQKT